MRDQDKQALEALFAHAQRRRRQQQSEADRARQELAEFRQRFEEHVDAVVLPTFLEFKGFLAGKGMASFIEREHAHDSGDALPAGQDIQGTQGAQVVQANPRCRFCIGSEGHAYTYGGYIQVEADLGRRQAVLTRKCKEETEPVEAAQGEGVFAYVSASKLHEELRALLTAIL